MVTATEPQPRAKPKTNVVVGNVISVRYDAITPDPDQPRKVFDEDGIKELAQSMDSNGLLQPISIRPDEENSTTRDKRYIIIAGERRWRAAGTLGWETIPAIIRKDLTDAQSAKFQLLENIVRRDLDPVEEARAFAKMMDEGHTLKEMSDAVGMSPAQISWRLQMLKSCDDVLHCVVQGHIQPSTALALSKLSVDQQRRALKLVIDKGLNHSQARILCDRINNEDAVVDLLGGVHLTEEQQRSVSAFQEAFKRVCAILVQVEETERVNPGSLASGLASPSTVEMEIDQVMQALSRVKRLLHTRQMEELVVSTTAAD